MILRSSLKEINCSFCPPGRYGETTQHIEKTVNGDKLELYLRAGIRPSDAYREPSGKWRRKSVSLNLALGTSTEAGAQTAIQVNDERSLYSMFADAPKLNFQREDGTKVSYRPFAVLSKVRTRD